MSFFGKIVSKLPTAEPAITVAAAQKLASAETGFTDRTTLASSLRAAAPSTVFVELGEASQKAQIARDGVGVPQIALNPDVLRELLAGRPQLVTKVVSQSVPPGTAVPRGTSIDIVLAQPGALPIDVLPDPHNSLRGQTLAQVFDTFVKDNADVRNVLARHDSATTLTTADQGVIHAAFAARDVPITTEPGETMDEAFRSLQAAFTFGA